MSSTQKNYNDHLTLSSPHLSPLKIGFHADHWERQGLVPLSSQTRSKQTVKSSLSAVLWRPPNLKPDRTLRNKHRNTEQHEGSHHTTFSWEIKFWFNVIREFSKNHGVYSELKYQKLHLSFDIKSLFKILLCVFIYFAMVFIFLWMKYKNVSSVKFEIWIKSMHK